MLLSIFKIAISPVVLIIISIIILLVYFIHKGTNFLSLKKIVKDYARIFSDAKGHVLIFWGVPILLAVALTQAATITKGLTEYLLVFLSILVSAFCAIMSVLVNIRAKEHDVKYQTVYKETVSTVLIEVVVCVFALLITLSIMVLPEDTTKWVSNIISFLDYYLIFAMILNLLILIKRIKALIDNA